MESMAAASCASRIASSAVLAILQVGPEEHAMGQSRLAWASRGSSASACSKRRMASRFRFDRRFPASPAREDRAHTPRDCACLGWSTLALRGRQRGRQRWAICNATWLCTVRISASSRSYCPTSASVA